MLLFQFRERRFDEDVTEKVRKERHRVPDEVIDFLADRLGPQLGHPTRRNQALSPRDQVILILKV